jgi:cobalamin biosynthesis protein CobT
MEPTRFQKIIDDNLHSLKLHFPTFFAETIPIIKDIIYVEPAQTDEEQEEVVQDHLTTSPNLLSVPKIDPNSDQVIERESIEERAKNEDEDEDRKVGQDSDSGTCEDDDDSSEAGTGSEKTETDSGTSTATDASLSLKIRYDTTVKEIWCNVF